MTNNLARTVLAGAALIAFPAFANAATLTVAESDDFGSYLAADGGKPVYLFTSDTQGKGDAAVKSSCEGKCLSAWPAVTGAPEAGEGVKSDLLGSFERADGTTQATYNGWPLYYFIKDEGADAPQGQDKHGFGAEWYLLTPSGEKVHE